MKNFKIKSENIESIVATIAAIKNNSATLLLKIGADEALKAGAEDAKPNKTTGIITLISDNATIQKSFELDKPMDYEKFSGPYCEFSVNPVKFSETLSKLKSYGETLNFTVTEELVSVGMEGVLTKVDIPLMSMDLARVPLQMNSASVLLMKKYQKDNFFDIIKKASSLLSDKDAKYEFAKFAHFSITPADLTVKNFTSTGGCFMKHKDSFNSAPATFIPHNYGKFVFKDNAEICEKIDEFVKNKDFKSIAAIFAENKASFIYEFCLSNETLNIIKSVLPIDGKEIVEIALSPTSMLVKVNSVFTILPINRNETYFKAFQQIDSRIPSNKDVSVTVDKEAILRDLDLLFLAEEKLKPISFNFSNNSIKMSRDTIKAETKVIQSTGELGFNCLYNPTDLFKTIASLDKGNVMFELFNLTANKSNGQGGTDTISNKILVLHNGADSINASSVALIMPCAPIAQTSETKESASDTNSENEQKSA